jgi:hypothetical protein
MTVTLVHRAAHPAVQKPYDVPLLSRTQITALIRGTHTAVDPNTPPIVDRIVSICAALATIDGRRNQVSELTAADARDYDFYKDPLPRLYRSIGLYPANT